MAPGGNGLEYRRRGGPIRFGDVPEMALLGGVARNGRSGDLQLSRENRGSFI